MTTERFQMNDLKIVAKPVMDEWATRVAMGGAFPVPGLVRGVPVPMSKHLFGLCLGAATRLSIAALLISSLFSTGVVADDPKTEKYSPEVVSKAEKILADNALRRSGKQIQSTGTTAITRSITGLTREKRELRLLQKDWDAAGVRLKVLRQQLEQLKQQRAELSLQLARVAGDTAANNRVVGLLNVNKSQMEQVVTEREKAKALIASKTLN